MFNDGISSVTIGVISDTHGLLRPEAVEALQGSDLILHAGDIGREDLLAELERIAPVRAIRGNVDRDPWAAELPETLMVEAGGRRIFMIHDIASIPGDTTSRVDAVIHGHSHMPSAEYRESVLFLNPGSAGRRRFKLPVAVALLRVTDEGFDAEIRELDV